MSPAGLLDKCGVRCPTGRRCGSKSDEPEMNDFCFTPVSLPCVITLTRPLAGDATPVSFYTSNANVAGSVDV